MFELIITAGLLAAVLSLAWCITEAFVSGLVAVLVRLFPKTFRG